MLMPAAPPPMLVCQTCAVHDLVRAVAQAPPRATIVVHGGVWKGGLVIRVPLTLRGEGGAMIDASGGLRGITVLASGVGIEHLTVRGTPPGDLSGDAAAIVVHASEARIEDDRFIDDAFAISLKAAPGSVIARNEIIGDDRGDPRGRGDAIRLWASPNTRIVRNHILHGRDVLISYSPGVTFEGNVVRGGRYGLHDMFSDGTTVRGNAIADCEVGANFMYARGLAVTGNVFRGNRGATGYGIGLESVDASTISGNGLFGNRVGINIIDSPTDRRTPVVIRGNAVAFNGSGLAVQSDAQGITVVDNAFSDNIEQIVASGGGALSGMTWSNDGRGNYWSDYAGYDRNGDGIGDVPYAPASGFESLADADPAMQVFRYSPASEAIELAVRALPAVAPQAKLIDAAPSMEPPELHGLPRVDDASLSASRVLSALAMLMTAPLLGLGTLVRSGKSRARKGAERAGTANVTHSVPCVRVAHARKTFGAGHGIVDVSFEVRPGEALALWGANGAGKSTLLRCLLGQFSADGDVLVYGCAPGPLARAMRSRIGYAPQRLPDFDLRVRELVALVAELRHVDEREAREVLQRFQLDGEAERFVPELSGGTKQRLGIALALIGDPPLLILDEPTAGLDRRSRGDLLSLLVQEKARGTTIVFASHLLEDVQRLADRVLVIEGGRGAGTVTAAEFVGDTLRFVS